MGSGWDFRRLFVSARRIGLSADEFWALAPCELSREIEAESLRREDEAKRDLVLAWSVAALTAQAQVGKLKNLETMLNSGEQTPRHSRDQQRQILMHLSDYYRIPLRTKH